MPEPDIRTPAGDGDKRVSVPLAQDRVPELVASLDVTDPVAQRAHELARHADESATVNRAPSAVAAAAVYVALRTHEDRDRPSRSQQAIADAGDVSTVTIRETYPELEALANEP